MAQADLPFRHSMRHGNMSVLKILRPDFTETDWKAFKVAHQQAYSKFDQFHFVYDICDIRPHQCSHIWPFIRYLTTEMKERSETQVMTVFIVHQHNGMVLSAIERMLNWTNNSLSIQFVESMDKAVASLPTAVRA